MSSPSILLPQRRPAPLPVKLLFTAFFLVVTPVYCTLYGPAVMCYFCDVALVLTLFALWMDSALITSVAATMIIVPQALWTADFFSGARMVHMTDYMFQSEYPLYSRTLSLFHVWLPVFLVWLVWRLGYDRRALLGATLVGWGLLTVSYLWLPVHGAFPARPLWSTNINYVYGLGAEPQTWMHPHLYFACLLAAFPLLFYVPAHLTLAAVFRRPVKA
jgi:hypothetical protein